MIILAAAIILSLSNSGIISKANKAKTDSDTANLKEYVNTLRAEWELMTTAEREKSGAATFEDYANKKLEEGGYKAMLSDDGVLMNEAATAAVKEGLKVGDVVTGYTVASTTYTTDGSEQSSTGTADDTLKQTVETNTAVTWKYLGISADGEIEIMADLTTLTGEVALGGKGGYLNGPTMLNTICEKLYSASGIGTARSMNIDDVNNLLGYTPTYTYTYNSSTITSTTPLTVGEIDNRLGTSLGSITTTPDGKALSTYKADCYTISKSNTAIKNTDNKSLVSNDTSTYWLASPCVFVNFQWGWAYFRIVCVSSWLADNRDMFYSYDDSTSSTNAVRPVVKLDPSVKLVKDATVANTWNISK